MRWFGKARRGSRRTRRAIGWMLSALVVLCYASPQASALRGFPTRVTIAAGQEVSLPSLFPLCVQLDESNVCAAVGSDDERLAGVQAGESTATISLLGLLPLKEVEIAVSDDTVLFPGGQAVGVAMHTRGVLVVGMSDLNDGSSPARLAGLKAGDLIVTAGGVELDDTAHLTQLVAKSAEKPLELGVLRGDTQLALTLQARRDDSSGAYRIGAWVRDSTAGVGTLSFYTQEEDGARRFGALGHAITDADTQTILSVGRGQLMRASIVDVQKGQRGVPGELKGSFLREGNVIGDVTLNNRFGIYGTLSSPLAHPLYPDGLKIGRKDAVHTGKASILCTLSGEDMDEYEVELVEVARQSEPSPRSMIVKVTDERLLEKTGGIVQGMSGSPILQDGRIVGAVTHVCVKR